MPVNSFLDYPMSWKPDKSQLKSPLYKSIALALEEAIRKGFLKPGDKLPPQRELADYLDINLSTITRAFKICELKGLISGTTGKGTYVSSDVQAPSQLLNINPEQNYIDMGASHPLYEQNKYIVEVMKKVINKTDVTNILIYSEPLGRFAHRINAKKWLAHFKIMADVDDIMIASGLQNALSIILTSLFQRGDKIATDSYIYPGFKALASMLGIRLIPIPYDNDKMDFQAFNKLCKNENIKGLYLMPDFNNPTTYTISDKERKVIANIIEENNLIFVEDGSYSFLSSEIIDPIYSLVPCNSIYISSVSNSLCTGLRVSFLVVSDKFKTSISSGISNINVMTSPFDTEIISRVIESDLYKRIIDENRTILSERNSITDTIFKSHKIFGHSYSQFRWLILPEKFNNTDFEKICKAEGIIIYSSERFIVGNSKKIPGVRIAISTPKNICDLKKGLLTLYTIIKS